MRSRGRRGCLRAVSMRYIVIERYDILHPGLRDAHTHISCKWRCGQQICWVYGNSECAASDKWSTKQQKWRQLRGLRECDSTIHAHTYAIGETSGGRVDRERERYKGGTVERLSWVWDTIAKAQKSRKYVTWHAKYFAVSALARLATHYERYSTSQVAKCVCYIAFCNLNTSRG